ncbi:hypothetical protein WFJ11_01555 [Parvimonas micra]|uniref:hypothetical protein n=1 Tax=Parvimonas micra TaxID=33033 RepID=UPI0030D2B188
MKTIFEKQHLKFTRKDGSLLTVKKDGVSYEDTKKEKKSFDISFDEISYIIALSYCNSNSNYNLLFEKKDKSTPIDFISDTTIINDCHNILETKSILLAHAAYKLTKDFPNNLDTLDIDLARSLKEKAIRISNGVISGAKHSININEIRRVQCASNGTISNLLIYKKEKKTFWNIPDMRIPCNEITLPLIEAIVTRNTGNGIDFSWGNGFDQKNSNYIIMRYMDSNFFINNDGTFDTEWQKQIYNRIRIFDHDLEYLLNK